MAADLSAESSWEDQTFSFIVLTPLNRAPLLLLGSKFSTTLKSREIRVQTTNSERHFTGSIYSKRCTFCWNIYRILLPALIDCMLLQQSLSSGSLEDATAECEN